jgi:hypothetical protein
MSEFYALFMGKNLINSGNLLALAQRGGVGC